MTEKWTTGSEPWACGWQNYTVDGWVYPYKQNKDESLKIHIDKNGIEYIRFIICTPRLFGNTYYFFPVVIYGSSLCATAKRLLRFGDFVCIVGYWNQKKVQLASYNGKTRLRDWNHIVCTRFNKMVHIRSRQEIDEYREKHGSEGLARTVEEIRCDTETPNPFNFHNGSEPT